jgi:hypothetical protein
MVFFPSFATRRSLVQEFVPHSTNKVKKPADWRFSTTLTWWESTWQKAGDGRDRHTDRYTDLRVYIKAILFGLCRIFARQGRNHKDYSTAKARHSAKCYLDRQNRLYQGQRLDSLCQLIRDSLKSRTFVYVTASQATLVTDWLTDWLTDSADATVRTQENK